MSTRYWDEAVKWWTGAAWKPQNVDYPGMRFVKEVPSAIATQIAVSANPTVINAGGSTTLTATITPAAATGTVRFTGPGFDSGARAVSGGVASAVVNPSATGTITAAYTATGAYLGSTANTTITVQTISYFTARSSAFGLSRSGYQWGMSSAPHTLQSTFTVGGGGNLPYNSVVVTGIRIEVAKYYSNPAGNTCTAGIYNSGGGALSTATRSDMGAAGGTDTPLSGWDIPDVTLGAGTYRIGFSFPSTTAIQWDYDSSASGYTYYADGAATGSKSLLWEIDYYVYN